MTLNTSKKVTVNPGFKCHLQKKKLKDGGMWIYYLEEHGYEVQPRDYLLELGLYFKLLNFPSKISFRNCSQRKILRPDTKCNESCMGLKSILAIAMVDLVENDPASSEADYWFSEPILNSYAFCFIMAHLVFFFIGFVLDLWRLFICGLWPREFYVTKWFLVKNWQMYEFQHSCLELE